MVCMTEMYFLTPEMYFLGQKVLSIRNIPFITQAVMETLNKKENRLLYNMPELLY